VNNGLSIWILSGFSKFTSGGINNLGNFISCFIYKYEDLVSISIFK